MSCARFLSFLQHGPKIWERTLVGTDEKNDVPHLDLEGSDVNGARGEDLGDGRTCACEEVPVLSRSSVRYNTERDFVLFVEACVRLQSHFVGYLVATRMINARAR